MTAGIFRKRMKAFTLIELLVVVALVLIIFVVFVAPPHRPSRTKVRLAVCLSNLRVVSLGFQEWQKRNAQLFPWQVSTNSGGSLETVTHGRAADHFIPLATILKDSSSLFCPADRLRSKTNRFVGFGNTNLSYFISFAATSGQGPAPSVSILAGDRGLSLANQSVTTGPLFITNYTLLGWKCFHPNRGNLAFVDGHAESVKTEALPGCFQRQAITTNHLVIP